MPRKIAMVVQRYGLEINGGAEYHARLIAERLGKYFTVEVFTTTAHDYVTWAHHYEKQREIAERDPRSTVSACENPATPRFSADPEAYL